MGALGRLFNYAFLGLLWLALLALVGVVACVFAYVFYVALVGVIGRVGTILTGVLLVTVYVALIYFARRKSRGKTEEELYNTWLLRSLVRIQNRRWPWSIYGLGPGRDVESTHPPTDPPAGGPRTG